MRAFKHYEEDGRYCFIYEAKAVKVLYTNHRKETAWRKVVFIATQGVTWDSSHHPGQPAIYVWDVDKQDYRTYALFNIHEIRPLKYVQSEKK